MIQYCEKCGQKYYFDKEHINKCYTCKCGFNIYFKDFKLKNKSITKYRINQFAYIEPWIYGITLMLLILIGCPILDFSIQTKHIQLQLHDLFLGFLVFISLSLLTIKSFLYAKLASKLDKNI
jgi:hypothetical protein